MNKIWLHLLLAVLLCSGIPAQEIIVFNSPNLPAPDSVMVFIPPGGSAGKPMLILLHGYSGSYTQWNKLADLQKEASALNYSIVCPDGLYSSWYANSPVNPKLKFVTFFFTELIPALKNKLMYDTGNVFISGLSMGGFGALHLLAQNPTMFRAAGSTSGILDISPFTTRWGLDAVFGKMPDNKEYFDQVNPVLNTSAIAAAGTPMLVDCGTEDFAFPVNQAFFNRALAERIPITFIAAPGKHNAAYWSESITWQLAFFKKHQKYY